MVRLLQAGCRAWIADTVAVSAITEQPSPVPADGRPPRRPGTGRPVGDPWARPAIAVRSLDSNSSCASKRERAPELVTAGLTQPWIASQAGRNHRAAVRPEHPVIDSRLPAVADHEGSPNPGGLSAAASQAACAAGRSGSLPVAFGAEFDVQCAQVLPPEIVQRRELVLAARVV